MNMRYRWLVIIPLCLLLGACASNQYSEISMPLDSSVSVVVPINYDLFTASPKDMISESQVFALTPLQQREFLTRFQELVDSGLAPHKALSEYMLQKMDGFSYHGKTYIAEQAMQQQEGNCMSLAIITTALARLVGLDYEYRQVNSLPVFDQQKDVLLSSSHVQTIIYAPNLPTEEEPHIVHRGSVTVDYFPEASDHIGLRQDDAQFLSLYFRNIAADALVAQDLDTAFHYAIRAFDSDSNSPEVLNLLAVLHRRKGDSATAEAIYQTALDRDQDNLALLSNYMLLLESQKRWTAASLLDQRLASLDDPNPYNWLEQAHHAYRKNQLAKAIRYYKKVLELAPYVRPAYLALYRIYMEQGYLVKARTTLEQVMQWTYEKQERKRYHFKLAGLRRTS